MITSSNGLLRFDIAFGSLCLTKTGNCSSLKEFSFPFVRFNRHILLILLWEFFGSYVLLVSMCIFQVTNPAIDPLREGLVMSLEVNIGKRGNILEVGPENVSQVHSHFRCLGFSDTFLSDY